MERRPAGPLLRVRALDLLAGPRLDAGLGRGPALRPLDVRERRGADGPDRSVASLVEPVLERAHLRGTVPAAGVLGEPALPGADPAATLARVRRSAGAAMGRDRDDGRRLRFHVGLPAIDRA